MAMRKVGLTSRDYVDPRSAGTGVARTFRDAAPVPGPADA